MVEKQTETGYKRCPECFEIVPYRVRICPVCKSYQDWRRYVAIGQINVALMIGLLSILTTFITLGLPILKSPNSSVSFNWSSTTDTGTFPAHATIIARNDGRSGGEIRLFQIEIKYGDAWDYDQPLHNLLPLQHAGTFVEAGKEQRFDVELRQADVEATCRGVEEFMDNEPNLKLHKTITGLAAVLNKFSCQIIAMDTGFYSTREVQRRVACDQIIWIRSCVFQHLKKRTG